ncbi:uncharacterized protein LOC129598559 [Paramacrobiotus metropolitanus]|uniref:uncharacterized protein LOC129598559 n=1 Tax=Paramacrobiotus metropolitanus TaxID=2943436 RepID=UPI0024465996|nr:uncharacterized protein LOC129598559 [Paramacrobiotus metropolitanus]
MLERFLCVFLWLVLSVLPLNSSWLIMDPQPPVEHAKRVAGTPGSFLSDQVPAPENGYRVGCLRESSFGRSVNRLYQRLLATPDPTLAPTTFGRPLSDVFWMDFLRILEREAQSNTDPESSDTKVILNFQPCSALRLRHFVIGRK